MVKWIPTVHAFDLLVYYIGCLLMVSKFGYKSNLNV